MLILIKNANKKNNRKQNFDGFRKKNKKMELLRLKGDLANFFQHYLDMENLLLNKSHFHRTITGKGILRQLETFYFSFSCNCHEYKTFHIIT